MSAKSVKSAFSETPPTKASPATPRVAKLSNSNSSSRGVVAKQPEADSPSPSPSPLPNRRSSIDRSPKLLSSKPATTPNRLSPKITTTPLQRPRTSALRSSELQAQLTAVQDDLKKAKEQIALIQKEKAQAIDQLKQAQRAADEADGKLTEALVAEKRAHDDSEIEKFRAVELEQASIEAAQKKEEEWLNEIEAVKNQHALDLAALLSATEELERTKQEVSMTSDAKNQALTHADEATKIAEIHAEKVEILSAELNRLKTMLESTCQTEANKNDEIVIHLNSEIDALKQELQKKKDFEEKFVERETFIEQLSVELEAARMTESYNRSLAEECQIKAEKLENQVSEANKLERSASESLDSVMKQLEGKNDLLHNAELEIDQLNEKMGLLEITIKRQKVDLEESNHILNSTKKESVELAKNVDSLKTELETVKEERIQALNNEKLAVSEVQNLLEEKNKLINELDISKEEDEKSKKAMESLASALHEISSEAREAKEKLLLFQTEHESYKNEVEDLKMVLKTANEKHENMLDGSKHEIDKLTESLKQCEIDLMNKKSESEQKELNFVKCVQETEEENAILRKEVDQVVNLLKQANDETSVAKTEEARLNESLKETEAEIINLQETTGEAKAESMKLKESMLDKETKMQTMFQEKEEIQAKEAAARKKIDELSKLLEEATAKTKEIILDKETKMQNILQENEELRAKEAAARQDIEELSKLLEEATAKIQTKANGQLTDSEKEYDLLSKVVEFSEENGHSMEKKTKELPTDELKSDSSKNVSHDEILETLNGKPKDDESNDREDGSVETECNMWESKIEKKESSPEQDSFQSKLEDAGEYLDEANGLTSTERNDDGGNSPTKQLKKKNPLLKKFGSLLKSKKGSSNHK
ncbi:hypothetical protein ACFE04_004743 [Oxalis oulophora]